MLNKDMPPSAAPQPTRREDLMARLAEKPQARGLAVRGMPMGSPGMEVVGKAPDSYEVVLFGSSGRTSFARYRGVNRV